MSKRRYTELRPRQNCSFDATIALNSTVLGKLLCAVQAVGSTPEGDVCVCVLARACVYSVCVCRCTRFNKFQYPAPSFPSTSLPTPPRVLLHILVVRSAVLQIKPACISLIEQNFNTGSTRNSAPWVTKHHVNTMVHPSRRCECARLVAGNREEMRRGGGWMVKSCMFGSLLKCDDGHADSSRGCPTFD